MVLERLAARQRRRQYSASNTLTSSTTARCADGDLDTGSSQQGKVKRVQSAQAWTRQRSAAAARQKETNPAEIGNFENLRDGKCDLQPVRRSQIVLWREDEDCEGSNPKHVRDRARRSSAADTAGSNTAGVTYLENQRNMIEQSRALLEQSKAKHHALVAQAHSMQKQLRTHRLSDPPVPDSADSQKTLAPKPPSASPAVKKPTSTFRTQRLARYNLYYRLN